MSNLFWQGFDRTQVGGVLGDFMWQIVVPNLSGWLPSSPRLEKVKSAVKTTLASVWLWSHSHLEPSLATVYKGLQVKAFERPNKTQGGKKWTKVKMRPQYGRRTPVETFNLKSRCWLFQFSAFSGVFTGGAVCSMIVQSLQVRLFREHLSKSNTPHTFQNTHFFICLTI